MIVLSDYVQVVATWCLQPLITPCLIKKSQMITTLMTQVLIITVLLIFISDFERKGRNSCLSAGRLELTVISPSKKKHVEMKQHRRHTNWIRRHLAAKERSEQLTTRTRRNHRGVCWNSAHKKGKKRRPDESLMYTHTHTWKGARTLAPSRVCGCSRHTHTHGAGRAGTESGDSV